MRNALVYSLEHAQRKVHGKFVAIKTSLLDLNPKSKQQTASIQSSPGGSTKVSLSVLLLQFFLTNSFFQNWIN